MIRTPKSLRLQIGIFGRTNVGKSSVLNMIAGQQVAITSPTRGTTTDVVEKSMELLPIGPVVFLDTAGIDDDSALADKRIARTRRIYRRADIAVLVIEPGIWGEYEMSIADEVRKASIPLIVIINKIDILSVTDIFLQQVSEASSARHIIQCSSIQMNLRDQYINEFKRAVMRLVPKDYISPPSLMGDLAPGGHALFIVPIDIEAPKGRIILPQVQAIRDMLDADGSVTIVKEHQYRQVLANCVSPPDIVVCDSQVVDRMVEETPEHIACTTFSTLFSRFKGDLVEQVRGVAVLDTLKFGDRILIGEACSHHPMEDDIGRVKIPAWLEEYLGFAPQIDVCSGRDYPENIGEYKLVIHCGACMLTRREMLRRIEQAKEAGVAVTNYGICISHIHGVLRRIVSPFPEAAAVLDESSTGRVLA